MELARTRMDDPVVGEDFNLTCRVSLYNFTRNISWLWTDSNGITTPISSDRLPNGLQLKFLSPFIFINRKIFLCIIGLTMFSPSNRTYSYAEGLLLSNITKKSSGIYTCQAAWLSNGTLFNNSATLNVKS